MPTATVSSNLSLEGVGCGLHTQEIDNEALLETIELVTGPTERTWKFKSTKTSSHAASRHPIEASSHLENGYMMPIEICRCPKMALGAMGDEMCWLSMLLTEVMGRGREKLTGMPMKDFLSSTTAPIFAVYQRINLIICRRRIEGRCVLREWRNWWCRERQ